MSKAVLQRGCKTAFFIPSYVITPLVFLWLRAGYGNGIPIRRNAGLAFRPMKNSTGMLAKMTATLAGPNHANLSVLIDPSCTPTYSSMLHTGRLNNKAVAVPGMYWRNAMVAKTCGKKTFSSIANA